MSVDYYARLERERGPQPSPAMLASIAQGMHLSLDERDHLFRLAGQSPPERGGASEHVSPGMLRVFDRLHDTPAEVVTELGETLRQNALGAALVGDLTRYAGPSRSIAYRWFADPEARLRYATSDHEFLSRMFASGLREIATLRGPRSRAHSYTQLLLTESEEFRELWALHEVGLRPRGTKNFMHPQLGALSLTCQTLVDPDQGHSLLVYTALPGSESQEKLRLLPALASA
jgi:hypothetical protein